MQQLGLILIAFVLVGKSYSQTGEHRSFIPGGGGGAGLGRVVLHHDELLFMQGNPDPGAERKAEEKGVVAGLTNTDFINRDDALEYARALGWSLGIRSKPSSKHLSEDSFAVRLYSQEREPQSSQKALTRDATFGLFAVFDGHGTHGRFASAIAVEEFKAAADSVFSNYTAFEQLIGIRVHQELMSRLEPSTEDRFLWSKVYDTSIRDGIYQIFRVLETSLTSLGQKGTTFTLIVWDTKQNKVYTASAGDSLAFAYNSRNSSLTLISEDHSASNPVEQRALRSAMTTYFNDLPRKVVSDDSHISLIFNTTVAGKGMKEEEEEEEGEEEELEELVAMRSSSSSSSTTPSVEEELPSEEEQAAAERSSTTPNPTDSPHTVFKSQESDELVVPSAVASQLQSQQQQRLSLLENLSSVVKQEEGSALGQQGDSAVMEAAIQPHDHAEKTPQLSSEVQAALQDEEEFGEELATNQTEKPFELSPELIEFLKNLPPLPMVNGRRAIPRSMPGFSILTYDGWYSEEERLYSADFRLGLLQPSRSMGDGDRGNTVKLHSFVRWDPTIHVYDASDMDYVILTSDGYTNPYVFKARENVYQQQVLDCDPATSTSCLDDPYKRFKEWLTNDEVFYTPFDEAWERFDSAVNNVSTALMWKSIEEALRTSNYVPQDATEKMLQESVALDQSSPTEIDDDVTVLVIGRSGLHVTRHTDALQTELSLPQTMIDKEPEPVMQPEQPSVTGISSTVRLSGVLAPLLVFLFLS